jgi:exonuclease III
MTVGTESREEGVSSTGNSERKPKLLSCKNKIRVATWNVRTLLQAGKLKELCETAERYHLDVVGVQEVRWDGKDKIRHGSWTFIYSGRDDKRHEAGVGLLLSKRAAEALTSSDCINERLLKVRLKAGITNMSVIVGYAPTEVANIREKELFYNQLDTILGAVRRHDMCLLLGDFNARVGRDVEVYPGVIGPHGVGDRNNNGQRLLDTCNTHGLCIGGTLFQHKFIHQYTWTSNTTGRVRAQLDHIIINQRWKRSLQDCRTYRGADIASDHELLIGDIKMRLARPKRGGQSKRFAVHKLNNPKIREEYEGEVEKHLKVARPEAGVEEDWQIIRDGLVRAAETTLGPPRSGRKEWISIATEELIDQRRAAKIRRDSVGTRHSSEEYRKLDKEVKGSARRDKQEWFNKCAEELEAAAKCNNQRKVYQLVKKMAGKRTPQPMAMKDKGGNILTEKEEVMCRWREHFQELLNRPDPVRRFHGNQHEGEDLDIDISIPTEEEVQVAVRKLKNNKAAGVDRVNAEMMKTGGEVVYRRLHSLIVKIWKDGVVPEDWRKSELVVLYKKGDTKECKNYRGISLLSVAGKAFARIVLTRMQKAVEKRLRENQAGFREGRGCIDQIFSLKILMEKCLEYQVPGVVTFVDFKAAFDSVHRPSLWKILREYCIPEKVVNIIKSTYSDCQARVRVGGEVTDWFCIETGVRQGCVWSPLLFGILIDWILKKACDGYGLQLERRTRTLRGTKEGWKLPDFDFADDVALLTSGERQATEALARLKRAGEEVGLVVSPEKTKVMTVGTTPVNVSDDGRPIDQVERFCYLGSTVTPTNSVEEEINIRIGRAAGAFQNLRNTWRAKIEISTKMKIYNAVVITTLLYGAETWAITKQQEQRIDAFDSRCLRSILNIRWWHHTRNTCVRERTHQPYASLIMKRNKMRWFGHVQRMSSERLPLRLYKWDPTVIGGKRKQGRQRQRWTDSCSRDLSSMGMTLREGENVAQDRGEWRLSLAALM